ncbi:UNKNOWN [Stylonychia lemnae]|uniref:Uncharacterized protein n=1 Tax=Stylonychia lemnae TaxID=5949 RepID=A0A078AWX1_STYLE|nr:UNKNOWN [Stylonychia lemnae]|eukprot:CDW85752.1 UNKNOWN [Stylonychia lemnae]
MSVAREAKQKEWFCNIFNTTQDRQECQLFTRKKRQDNESDGQVSRSASRSAYDMSGDKRQDLFYKKKEGGLFLYESASSRSLNASPGFGSSKRVKDSLSMQKILQPYLALDVIRKTKEGLKPNLEFNNSSSQNKNEKTSHSNGRICGTTRNIQNPYSSEIKIERQLANVEHGKTMDNRYQLKMDSIKEEDNSIFKGLGNNHNKSMIQAAVCQTTKSQRKDINLTTSDCSPINSNSRHMQSILQQNQPALKQFKPVLQDRQNYTQGESQNGQQNKNQSQTKFTPYFMHVLNNSKHENHLTSRNFDHCRKPSNLSKSMIYQTNQDQNECQDTTVFKGIGQNHQKDMDRSQGRDIGSKDKGCEKQRFQISSAHDWKTEIFKASASDINPKEMVQQQQRSQLDSNDLVSTLKTTEIFQKQFGQTGELNKEILKPGYLETNWEKYQKNEVMDEKNIQILSLNIQQLPEGDERDIIKTLFKNQHVISLKKDTNSISGLSSGSGKVQLRCKDRVQTTQILQNLNNKGIKFEVQSAKNPHDITVDHSNDIKRKDLEDVQKNTWLKNLNKEEKNQYALIQSCINRSTSQGSLMEISACLQNQKKAGKSQVKVKEYNDNQYGSCTGTTNYASSQQNNRSFVEYLSSRSINHPLMAPSHNMSQIIQNTSIDDGHSYLCRSIETAGFNSINHKQVSTPNRLNKSKGVFEKNKENQQQFMIKNQSMAKLSTAASQDHSISVPPKVQSFKKQQEMIQRLTTQNAPQSNEKQVFQQRTNHLNVQNNASSNGVNGKQQPGKSPNVSSLNPNSSLLKPTQSSRGKRNFI